MNQPKSLKDLLLVHELIFILLVILAVTAGAIGIHLRDHSSHESQRINLQIQEIQQTRGDLYRQMKELFDGYFLADKDARKEYDVYTISIEKHFAQLSKLAVGQEEQAAIQDLHQSYSAFLSETSILFNRTNELFGDTLKNTLNNGLESGVFQRYELLSAHAERLLTLKQEELQLRLQESKHTSIVLLIIPIVLSIMLLLFSRFFLKRAIVRPIEGVVYATTEISAGRLTHKVPEVGAAELATLSRAINHMAAELARSQEALIRTETQAAQGQLVPMLAHNIRNPLASIRATAQVTDSPHLDADIRESLQAIINTVDRLERWTGSLLAYLHPLKPQLSEVRLQQIVQGALIPLQQKLREKAIKLELPAWETMNDKLVTDEHLLEQAIYNLLQNAIEASPSETSLAIQAEFLLDSVILQISDCGPGMPFIPDPHSISPGPSTKRFGTGLGIPFAFKVCEALSGNISFNAKVGGGTLIRLELPRNQPAI
ncbi:MAG TPA: HAMP domain-containing sensor histidine kinase [Methylophilaceae bacterium]|jgi:signal transduction histidine kinase